MFEVSASPEEDPMITAEQIYRRYHQNSLELGARIEARGTMKPSDPAYNSNNARIRMLQNMAIYLNREHKRLTGRPLYYTVKPVTIDFGKAAKEARQRAKEEQTYRKAVRNDYLRFKSCLDERRGLKDMLQNYIAKNWHVMFLITLSGGRSWTNLMLIESTLLKKAEHHLKQADRLILTGRHAQAVAFLDNAATYLNTAGAELSKFQDSLQTGTDRVVTTIKVTSSIMTPPASGLSAGATVGMSVFKAGVEHGTGLAAQAVDSKRSVSQKELKNAAKDVLIEGGSAAAGEFGKSLLAGPMASLLYKGKPTQAQINAVGNVISEYYGANSKQLMTAIRDISDGKKPTYKMLAGLIAPVLKSRSGGLPKDAGEVLSDDQVAKELENLVTKRARTGLASSRSGGATR
jgi:hypothetical protein